MRGRLKGTEGYEGKRKGRKRGKRLKSEERGCNRKKARRRG